MQIDPQVFEASVTGIPIVMRETRQRSVRHRRTRYRRTRHRLGAIAAAVLSFALAGGAAVAADDVVTDEAGLVITARLADERVRFAAAREALAAGDRTRFARLEASLADYPLHDWLVHERLRERFRRQTPTEADIATVGIFEEATGDAVLAGRLVQTLQSRFAELENWPAFLALVDAPHARTMPCETLQAREATAPMVALDEDALALWVEPGTRSEACTEVLAALIDRVPPSTESVWARVYAAMDAGRPEHAEAALAFLGTRDRGPIEAWIAARPDPGPYLLSGALGEDTMLNRRFLADLVLEWSREDTTAAFAYWLKVYRDYAFYDDRQHDTHRALVMRAAYRRMPEAIDWLDTFEPREDDLEFAEWRVRVALLAGDWRRMVRALDRLPPEERLEDHWAYWDARALEETGDAPGAEAIYRRLAALQSWHGFLSAERLGLSPMIEEVPIVPPVAVLERLAAEPALVRAREYHRVGLAHEGRREWNAWQVDRSEDESAAAAVLAADWRLDDRAIFSAGSADRRQALSLRFPVLYADEVRKSALEQLIGTSWIYGVARRESAWIADIRSPAGAMGLMQLMPATAKDVAGWRGQDDWNGDLTDPAVNIAFGAHYLRYVLDRFDGHQVLATASYNAGPHRVAGWLPEGAPMEADRWIDTIPFSETRRYVRAVLAYAAIYEKRTRDEDYGLLERLSPVPMKPVEASDDESDEKDSAANG